MIYARCSNFVCILSSARHTYLTLASALCFPCQQLDDIDPDAVAKGLDESEAAVAASKDDLERAEAQIGVDVYMAMQGALTMNK